MRRIFFWVFAPFMVLALLVWRLIPFARPVPSASAVRRFLILAAVIVLVAALAWRFYSHLDLQSYLGHERSGLGLIVEDSIVHAPNALRAGDLLLGWERSADASRAATSGPFRSPFDFAHILLAQAPRGGLRLSGVRGEALLSHDPSSLYPAPITRPRLDENDLEIYTTGRELLAAGRQDEALSLWRDTARAWRRDGMSRQACWLFFVIAQQLADDEPWDRAQLSYQEAISDVGRDDPHVVALIKLALAKGLADRGEFERAAVTYHEALAIRQAIDPDGLSVADVLFNLGSLAATRDDLAEAETWHTRALTLREGAAPASFEVVQSLGALAAIARAEGDRERAFDLYQRAVAVHRPLTPAGRWLAGGLDFLGKAMPPNIASPQLTDLDPQPPDPVVSQEDGDDEHPRRSLPTPVASSIARSPRTVADPPLHGLKE